ncbi:hypothetical protein [Krasilnikovia sp. MM14-A1004]|uniref:hypothetical protein n=1 Tax=Krasilnikovia sp. MM14-A1004 TaxID=3373541 RepID=UPI00399D2D69
MSPDAPQPDPGTPTEPTPTFEPALIDLSAPSPAPRTPKVGRYVRAVLVPSAPGRVAYGLAWLCILTLVVTAIVYTQAPGDHWRALTIVLSAVGVVAAACLHLAAVSINRRRDLGYSIFAAGLVVLMVLPAAYVAFTFASFGAAMTNLDGDSAGSSVSVDPGSDSDGDPTGPDSADGEVPCEAPDGSPITVDPDLCIDGHYNP